MKKSILEIYSLLVCFVTLCCFVILLGIGIYDIIEISNPEFTINPHEFNRHQNNETYVKSSSNCEDKFKEMSDDEITEKRLSSYSMKLKSEKRKALQSLIQVIIIMLIDIAVFIIHWKLAIHARKTSLT